MNKIRRIVVKFGTKVLTDNTGEIDRAQMRNLVGQIAELLKEGIKVVLVTSGAIACGMRSLGYRRRPVSLNELQSAASVGQICLMDIYKDFFAKRGFSVAQILLTQDDLDERRRYLNAKNTIDTLLSHGVVPIVNENDTVSTEEIKFGDNDKLASLVACLVEADELIILSDVSGLCKKKVGKRYDELISVAFDIDDDMVELACDTDNEIARGGMISKLQAAKVAQSSGILCVLAEGRMEGVLAKIVNKGRDEEGFRRELVGTAFFPKAKLVSRKRWLAFASRPSGAILVDAGARDAIAKRGKSLLASGIIKGEGNFKLGDMVSIKDEAGREFGRGLINYTAKEVGKIKGLKTGEIKGVLGYKDYDEVIHRDNLVVL